MRPARSLLIYFAAVFIGGALLAPWLYFLVQNIAPHSHLAASPFHRYLDRSLLGIALIGLWPLLRARGVTSWPQVGIVTFEGRQREAGAGFLLGFVSLLVLLAFALLFGARTFAFHPEHISSFVVGAAATAIIVSFLEEILFRGALFGLLRQAMRWQTAVFLSSLVYALLHFLQKTDLPGPVTWASGLRLLPLLFRNLTDFHLLIPAILNLTIVGAALAVAYQRTGALYGSMGLHAGWIFSLKTFQLVSEPNPSASVWLWGGDNPLNGWFTLPLLLVALFLTTRWPSSRRDV
jgi:membrane protease YdiL (CAAX protease family)